MAKHSDAAKLPKQLLRCAKQLIKGKHFIVYNCLSFKMTLQVVTTRRGKICHYHPYNNMNTKNSFVCVYLIPLHYL